MPELPRAILHYADAANVASIERDGLLSTNALLRRDPLAKELEAEVRAHRPRGITLPNGTYVRDQAPMPPAALARCLDAGMTPRDWYDLLNDHVFFWLEEDRVKRHATALCHREQLLLTVDARALAEAYEPMIYVTPFNVGNARRAGARRGARTLVPLATWRESAWKHETASDRSERAPSHRPAELLVRGAIPDIARFIMSTERVAPATS